MLLRIRAISSSSLKPTLTFFEARIWNMKVITHEICQVTLPSIFPPHTTQAWASTITVPSRPASLMTSSNGWISLAATTTLPTLGCVLTNQGEHFPVCLCTLRWLGEQKNKSHSSQVSSHSTLHKKHLPVLDASLLFMARLVFPSLKNSV
jgi:hypothetical protein